MKFTARLFLIILPTLILAIPVTLLNPDRKYSYNHLNIDCNNRAKWIYYRLFTDTTSIDIALINSSKTMNSVDDSLLQTNLSAKESVINISNLGYCRLGRNLDFVICRDLIEQKHPKMIVLEVREDESKFSHPMFPDLATGHDLIASPIWMNRNYFEDWIRFFHSRRSLIMNQFLNASTDNSQTDQSSFGFWGSPAIANDLGERNKKSREEEAKQKELSWFARTELIFPFHYLNKIFELCEKNNCRLVFLFLPDYESNLSFPLQRDLYESKGELLVLPDMIRYNPENWQDKGHLNMKGANLVTQYLLEFFKREKEFNSYISRL